MKRAIILLTVILTIGLFGCSTKQNFEGKKEFIVDIVPTEPIIVYNIDDVHDAVEKIEQLNGRSIGKTNLLNLPVFNRLRRTDSMPLNRAYAIGYPHTVGGSYAYWDQRYPDNAVIKALKACLRYAKERESHLSEKAGSQLILFNNMLLVPPEKLPTSFYVPYIMKATKASGESSISHGMFQYEGPGTNLELKLYNNRNEIVGEGTYSLTLLQAAFDTGNFKMKFYPENCEVRGGFTTEEIMLRHKGGSLRISKGKASLPNGGEIRFFTGVSIDYLDYYNYLLE